MQSGPPHLGAPGAGRARRCGVGQPCLAGGGCGGALVAQATQPCPRRGGPLLLLQLLVLSRLLLHARAVSLRWGSILLLLLLPSLLQQVVVVVLLLGRRLQQQLVVQPIAACSDGAGHRVWRPPCCSAAVLRVLLLGGKSHGRQRRRGASKVLIDDWDASGRAASVWCCCHRCRSRWQRGRGIAKPAIGAVLLHLLGRGRLAWPLVRLLRRHLACGSRTPSLLLAATACGQLLLLLLRRRVKGLSRLQHLLLRVLPRGHGPLLRHMRCTGDDLPG